MSTALAPSPTQNALHAIQINRSIRVSSVGLADPRGLQSHIRAMSPWLEFFDKPGPSRIPGLSG
jgi:hypothetical protein